MKMSNGFGMVLWGYQNLRSFRPERSYAFKEDCEYKFVKKAVPMELGKVSKLYDKMFDSGEATDEEFIAVMKYGIVLLRASQIEGGLDYKKAKEALGIKELMKKYK